MRYKKKLIVLLVLVGIVAVMQYSLPYNPALIATYGKYIFHPFQSIRNIVLGLVPFSIGDVLYISGAVYLIYLIGKWVYLAIKFKTHSPILANSLLHTVMAICICYILFFMGWGGNYYKSSLASFWNIEKAVAQHHDSTSLEAFDRFLISNLNAYAKYYQPVSFEDAGTKAKQYYISYTNNTWRDGHSVKRSLFGPLMQYFGIQGYYNPFTGEAQVNQLLPAFMLPFVMCHEMAHQSGIAAEDDANLLAYAVGVTTPDPVFRYSSYLNLWLYTNARLSDINMEKARAYRKMLNPLTIEHLDILKSLRKRYNSEVGVYSGQLYDEYLKLHHQKDGIESYNRVAITAWAWEQSPSGKAPIVAIP